MFSAVTEGDSAELTNTSFKRESERRLSKSARTILNYEMHEEVSDRIDEVNSNSARI